MRREGQKEREFIIFYITFYSIKRESEFGESSEFRWGKKKRESFF